MNDVDRGGGIGMPIPFVYRWCHCEPFMRDMELHNLQFALMKFCLTLILSFLALSHAFLGSMQLGFSYRLIVNILPRASEDTLDLWLCWKIMVCIEWISHCGLTMSLQVKYVEYCDLKVIFWMFKMTRSRLAMINIDCQYQRI